MISQALLVGNFEAAVDICVDSERMVKYCNSIAVLYIRSLGAAEGQRSMKLTQFAQCHHNPN